jgi:hypothetical protein
MAKNDTAKADNVAVSVQPTTDIALTEYRDEIEISGSLDIALSADTQDALALELRELMGQIGEGFGELTKPSDIFAMDQPFWIIGAATIDDFMESRPARLRRSIFFALSLRAASSRQLCNQRHARVRR